LKNNFPEGDMVEEINQPGSSWLKRVIKLAFS